MTDNDSCPKCKSGRMIFDCIENVGVETAFYDARCEDCGFEGRQWVKLTFDGWQELRSEGYVKI